MRIKKEDKYVSETRGLGITLVLAVLVMLSVICFSVWKTWEAEMSKPLEERIVQRFEKLEFIGTSSNKKNKTERSYGSIVNSMIEAPIDQCDLEDPLEYEVYLLSDEYQIGGISTGIAIKYSENKWFVVTDQILVDADAYSGPAALKFFEQ